MRFIRDAVWGQIRLNDEEYALANTFEMLRLNRLRQLHLCYLVYPTATHTRYAHSLGTLYVAQRVAIDSELPITQPEKRLLRLAALLHDVGHSAFAHVLEPTLPGMRKHDSNAIREDYILEGNIIDALRRLEVLPSSEVNRIEEQRGFVSQVLNAETIRDLKEVFRGKRPVISELLESAVDVDTLDYIARDSYYLGMLNGGYDRCIFASFRIEPREVQGRVVPTTAFADDERVHSALEDVIFSRWYLFKNAYLHPTVMAANAMLSEALRIAIAHEDADRLYMIGEDELLDELARKSEDPRVRTLAARLLSRHLYKPVYSINTLPSQTGGIPDAAVEKAQQLLHGKVDSAQSRLWAEFIQQARIKSGLDENPLVGYPLIPPQKDYSQIPIEGNLTYLDVNPSEISVYKERYARLSDMYVYSPDPSTTRREALREFCVAYFGYAGTYPRRTGLEDSPLLRMIVEATSRLRAHREAAAEVLLRVVGERPVTLQDLQTGAGDKYGLSKATLSTHLKAITDAFRHVPQDVVVSRLRGTAESKGANAHRNQKIWWVPDQELRQLIKSTLVGGVEQ